MSARDEILAALRRNAPAALPRPDVAPFTGPGTGGVEGFARALEGFGGRTIADLPPAQALRQAYPDAARIASVVPEIGSDRVICPDTDPRTLEDVDVAVFRAPFGVAETGSIFVSERVLVCSALAFYAQHLFVLLDPAAIVDTIHDAYARPEFDGTRYASFITGPSATADIEGVLVRGAQGPRSLTVCWAAVG